MTDPTPESLLTGAIPLLLACGTGIFALGLTLWREPLGRLANCLDQPRPARLALATGVLVYLAWMGALCLARHWALGTGIYDLGNVEQALWNTLHGDFFRMTTDPELESNIQLGTRFPDLPDTRWAFHVEPVLLLALPVYRIIPRAETLLVLQTLLLAAGSLSVHVAARDLTGRRSMGVAFAWLYLLSPQLHRANLFDVHPYVFAAPFLLGAWALARRARPASAFVLAGLALACREDLVAPVALLAIIWIFFRPRVLGFATLALAAAWGAIVFGAILPAMNPAGYIYTARLALARSPAGLALLALEEPGSLLWFLAQPDRLAYYAYLGLPLAFLPLAAPHLLALGLPAFASVVFSIHGEARLLLGHYHYHAMILPGLLLGGMQGMAVIGRRLGAAGRRRLAPAACCTMLVMTIGTGLAWRTGGYAWPARAPAKREAMLGARAMIPPEASVAASYDLGAQIAARRNLFTLYAPRRARADYIFLSRCDRAGCDGLEKSRYDEMAANIRADPAYEVIFDQAGITLLRRKT